MSTATDVVKPDTYVERSGWNYRSVLWWLAVVAYSIANVFSHERVNKMAETFIRLMGLSWFFWTTRILVLAGALIILFCRRNFLKDRRRLTAVLLFIIVGVALDMSLVIYASERVHYPQYALLTWIAYHAIGTPLPAAMLSFVVGYADEAHQHWIIYGNDATAYFDWNDNVLNLLGAVSPLVLLPPGPKRKLSNRTLLAGASIWTFAMSLLVVFLNPDGPLMRDHRSESFWLTSGVNTHYHVLNTLEGTILLGLCWIVLMRYYWPERSS